MNFFKSSDSADPVFLKEFLTTYRSLLPGGGCGLLTAFIARDKTATEEDSRVVRLRCVGLCACFDSPQFVGDCQNLG